MLSGTMAESVQGLLAGGSSGVGQFIVLWFIVGGAITFGIVVLTASYDWPGLIYVAIWLAIGLLMAPWMLRGESGEPL